MLNYSVFNQGRVRDGVTPTAFNGPPVQNGALAASSDSAAILANSTLVLTADEDMRVSIVPNNPAGADPGAGAMKLKAGSVRSFDLGKGSWYLRWVGDGSGASGASAAVPVYTRNSLPAALAASGSVTLAANAQTQLAAAALSVSVTVRADPANTVAINVGKSDTSASVGYTLEAGASQTFYVADASAIYAQPVSNTAGQKLRVTGS